MRSIRYVKEVPFVNKVIVNDIDLSAVNTARENMERNQINHGMYLIIYYYYYMKLFIFFLWKDLYEIIHGDACNLMYKKKNENSRFDVIDLDPYGTAVPFLDSAVQCIEDGGLLCVTCTDAAVLCGTVLNTRPDFVSLLFLF